MAQRYSEWAQQQVDRAKLTVNPKARKDRLALDTIRYWRNVSWPPLPND
jgi:hypothetical protein